MTAQGSKQPVRRDGRVKSLSRERISSEGTKMHSKGLDCVSSRGTKIQGTGRMWVPDSWQQFSVQGVGSGR